MIFYDYLVSCYLIDAQILPLTSAIFHVSSAINIVVLCLALMKTAPLRGSESYHDTGSAS